MLFTPWQNTLTTLSRSRALWRLMFLCGIASLSSIVLFVGGIIALLQYTAVSGILWLDLSADVAGSLVAILLGWFLFPLLMPLIAGLMEDAILNATYIELKKEKKDLPPKTPCPFWQSLGADIRFGLLGLILNILFLPLYFIPVVNVFIYYALNGYLLGRGFFTLAARSFLGSHKKAKTLGKRQAFPLFLHGILLAFLATVPIVSFIVPFLGLVLMTYVFLRTEKPK